MAPTTTTTASVGGTEHTLVAPARMSHLSVPVNTPKSSDSLTSWTDMMQKMYYLLHRLGIQSNVVAAAEYTGPDAGAKLSRHDVLDALRSVVNDQPMLRCVGVPAPSQQKGRTSLDIVMLDSIDLEDCVEFIDDAEDKGVTAELIERAQNEWSFNSSDKPWFKLTVVGGKTVVFAFHHSIGDGISGHLFHRQFLARLNAQKPADGDDSLKPWVVQANPSALERMPRPLPVILGEAVRLGKPWQKSQWELAWLFIQSLFMQLLFGRWFMMADLPASKTLPKSLTVSEVYEEKTQSGVCIGRISEQTMKRIIAACRVNGTTFTALLGTILYATLAHDFYPQAAFTAEHYATDLRQRLPEPLKREEEDRFACLVGAVSRTIRTRDYGSMIASAKPKAAERLDAPRIWEAARSRKEWIHSAIDKSARLTHAGAYACENLEQLKDDLLPKLGVGMGSGILVSNIGIFSAAKEKESPKKGGWTITDMGFSQSHCNGNYGCRGAVFGITGVEGGNTVVTVAYEQGIETREKTQQLIDSVIHRMEVLTSETAPSLGTSEEARRVGRITTSRGIKQD